MEPEDYLIFSNGYLAISSGFTGLKRIVHEFTEIDTPYAKTCHLMRDNQVYQVNYNGEKLYNALSLFLSNPDQSASMSKYSFRISFIDYIVDWVKTPIIYTKVPKFFYANSQIDTLITPFFYTTETGIAAGHTLEIDEHKLCTKVEALSNYWKVWVRAANQSEEITINKEKYLVRDYNLPSTDATLWMMPKVMFHDQYISLGTIPVVDISTDITNPDLRTFRTIYEWANIDISNDPFRIDIDATWDLTQQMYVSDFTMTHNLNTSDNVLFGVTSKVTDIKKGDWLLIKNAVYSEIVQVLDINVAQNSYSISRPFKKYEFLMSDDTIKLYWNKRVYLQPILLNFGQNRVNYPVLFNLEVKYLNI